MTYGREEKIGMVNKWMGKWIEGKEVGREGKQHAILTASIYQAVKD